MLQLLELVPTCPDSLAWDNEQQLCRLECIYPLYSKEELKALLIIDQVLAIVSIACCYFYCFTALFRPIMTKFPNVNVFFFLFSCMIFSSSMIIPLLLGDRYVFCDTNTTLGSKNWACVVSGFLFFYGYSTGFCWFVIFHLTAVTRIYLVHLPAITKYLYFIISYFTWPLICVIIGFANGYNIYYPGNATCNLENNTTFLYASQYTIFYIFIVVTLICCILISYRLIKVKRSTGVSWKVVVIKQVRLFTYWLYFLLYIVILTVLVVRSAPSRTGKVEEKIEEYEICVRRNGDDEDCTLDPPLPSYSILVVYHLITGFFPIITFLLLGARKDLLLFWKEYFRYCLKNKTLVLQFTPSFDPSLVSSSSATIQELDEIEQKHRRNTRIKSRVNEL